MQSKRLTIILLTGILVTACLFNAAPSMAQTGGETGGEGQGNEASGAATDAAADAAADAADASAAADAAAKAAQAAKVSSEATQAAKEASSEAAGTMTPDVTLSTPGQGVRAAKGIPPIPGVSAMQRAKLDAVTVNPQAWSPF